MCSFQLQLPTPVNQVTFLCQPQRTNQLAALTSDGHIYIYSQGGPPRPPAPCRTRSTAVPLRDCCVVVELLLQQLCSSLFLFAGSAEQPDGGVDGFRTVSPPLVLQGTFRYRSILLILFMLEKLLFNLWTQLGSAPMQGDVCPGGAAGTASSAVAGRASFHGREVRSTAGLLHPADAPAGC